MLIFKTDVNCAVKAAEIIATLTHTLAMPLEANFDLEDCDRVLRLPSVNHSNNLVEQVCNIISSAGFNAEILTDEIFVSPLNTSNGALSLQLLSSLV